MRTAGCLGLVVAVVLALTGGVRAGDRETALALIDQAIKAQGGEVGLTKAQTLVRMATGTFFLGGETGFTSETTFGLPGRAKMVVKLDKGGQIIQVLNGDRGWSSAGGMVNEMPREGIDELREEVYVEWLTTLVPLKKEGFTLTPVAALGVKVSSKGHNDAILYFDKDSGLLVKFERQSREAGILAKKEYVLGGFKEFDGVKLPTKRTELLNGKKIAEVTSASYKFLSKADDAMFGRP